MRKQACFLLAFLLSACQQQMANQPNYRPLQPSAFFADGRSSRPLVPGTVARGQLVNDPQLLTGKKGPGTEIGDYVETYPEPLTRAVLERGQERYTIFCALCHDPLGTGRGKIVERGYVQPPSYQTDLSRGFLLRGQKVSLRDAPVGYFLEVITQGFGAMPAYASQVPPRDRWAIIAYIRALQLSQQAPLADLPAPIRQEALKALEEPK